MVSYLVFSIQKQKPTNQQQENITVWRLRAFNAMLECTLPEKKSEI